MSSLSASASRRASPETPVTPYWHCMPSFFAYPLRRPALDLLGITVLLGVVPLLLDVALLTFACLLAMGFILAKYGYESLLGTAAGDRDPPALREALTGEGYLLPVKQGLVIVVLLTMVGIAFWLGGPFLGVPAIIGVTLLLPASVILLGMERSFRGAVNPVRLVSVAAAIGWPYLGLFGLLLCIELASATSVALAGRLMPGQSGLVIQSATTVFLGNYFTLMAFHLLGYVVYQYHEPLGYSAVTPEDEGPEAELGLFHELMDQGQHQAAMAELQGVMDRYPEEPSLRHRLLQLARLSGDAVTLRRVGGGAIGERLRSGRAGEAADIYLDCLGACGDYRPAEAGHHEPLARELRARGRTREALALLNGLHRQYPEHPAVPAAYLLAARIFLDDAGKPEQAGRILRFLRQNYPDSPYQPEIDGLLRATGAAG